MMQINPGMPELEDRYNAIKTGFAEFGIEAVRADEIEHSEVITDKIMEKIRSSEFLLADLSGERPSVYYEIGYAHALKRRVIMYRSKGTNLHFDLAAYNCPEYSNLTDLKSKLIARLSFMTNKNPKNCSP
jgi:nucleoside 2-deoxyribosyltransferase